VSVVHGNGLEARAAALGAVDAHGVDVLAGDAPALEVGAVTPLFFFF
jgi:hypothetical protein